MRLFKRHEKWDMRFFKRHATNSCDQQWKKKSHTFLNKTSLLKNLISHISHLLRNLISHFLKNRGDWNFCRAKKTSLPNLTRFSARRLLQIFRRLIILITDYFKWRFLIVWEPINSLGTLSVIVYLNCLCVYVVRHLLLHLN